MLDPSPKKAWSLFQIEVLNQETTAQVGLVLESRSRWSVLSEIFPGSWGVDDTVKPGTSWKLNGRNLLDGKDPH